MRFFLGQISLGRTYMRSESPSPLFFRNQPLGGSQTETRFGGNMPKITVFVQKVTEFQQFYVISIKTKCVKSQENCISHRLKGGTLTMFPRNEHFVFVSSVPRGFRIFSNRRTLTFFSSANALRVFLSWTS